MNYSVNKLMDNIDEEEIRMMIDTTNRIKRELSVEYQLGLYIGESIEKELPTLALDFNFGEKAYKLSSEHEDEYYSLTRAWSDKIDAGLSAADEWIEYTTFVNFLKKTYLPPVFECYVRKIMVDKIEDVKFGIRKALWNSDKCSYHCNPKDIEIEEDDLPYGLILLPQSIIYPSNDYPKRSNRLLRKVAKYKLILSYGHPSV